MPSHTDSTLCLDEHAVLDFVDGRQSAAERTRVHDHIAECSACAALVADLARALGDATGPSSTIRSATANPPDVDEWAAPLARGTEVGRYRIVSVLAAGGMGVVYVADDPRLDRRVALKLLRADLVDPHASHRLRREAQALARLSSPHVVTVHAAGSSPLGVWVAMDLVEGRTLAAWLSETARPWTEVLANFRAAAIGLRDAHAAGVVHRDFKPSNVLLGDDGRVLVADFGLASSLDVPEPTVATTVFSDAAQPTRVTRTGGVVGTPAYMSPEQLGGGVADARSDQFSFCVALYEGLCGRRPYAGTTLEAQLDAIRHGRVRPTVDGRVVPGWLRRAVIRGLNPNPARRYRTMAQLIDAIDPHKRRRRLSRWAAVAMVLPLGGAAWLGQRSAESPCDRTDERMAAVWSEEHRAAIASAFAASDDPGAPRQLANIERQLGARVKAWHEADARACEAARSRSATDLQLDRRFGCLRTVLDETELVVDALGSADAAMVRRADTIIPSLTSVERCEDPAYLNQEVGDALDPATAEAVEALRHDAAQARTRLATSRQLDVAVTQLGALHERAQELRYEPLVVSIANSLGRALILNDDPSAAIEHLEPSYFIALRLGDHAAAADAALQLAQAIGHGQAQIDDALRWIRHAEAAARAAGNMSTQGVVSGLIEGELLTSSQRNEEAEEVLLATRALLSPESGLRRRASIAETLGNLYASQWLPDKALPFYEEALALHEERVGPDHHDLLRALNGQAICLIQLERLDAAAATLERAIEIAKASGTLTAGVLVQLSTNLGALREQSGELEEALAIYRESLAAQELRVGPDHEETLIDRYNVANILRKLGRCDESISIATGLIERGLSHQPPAPNMPLRALWVLAECYQMQGRAELAMSTHKRRLDLLLSHTPDDAEAIASTRQALRTLAEPSPDAPEKP